MYQVERIQQLQQSQGGGDVSGHAESSDDSSHDVVGGLPFAVSTPVPQREQPWVMRLPTLEGSAMPLCAEGLYISPSLPCMCCAVCLHFAADSCIISTL